MKKFKFYVLSMMVLGLSFVGCDSSSDVRKSVRINNIVNPPNTMSRVEVAIGAGDFRYQEARGHADISNQTVTVDLYFVSNGTESTQNPWTGGGEWRILLKFRDSNDNHMIDFVWKGGELYDIKNAVTKLDFADFVFAYEEGK